MSTASIDIYAATNPALLSLILRACVEGYVEKKETPMPLPLALLPIPIVLNREVVKTFDGTNSTTGLITWVTWSPEVTLRMREHVEATSIFSRNALLFGLRYGVFGIDASGGVTVKDDGLTKKPPTTGDSHIVEPLKLAKRLGIWLAQAGSSENIFRTLGTNQ